jgi:UMF1 family MFS transporter
MSVFVRSFTRMGETFRELRHWKAAFLMMLAFLIYNDGIGTIIRMAVTFGEEKAIPAETMLAVILTVQFVGIPFSILFGRLAGRIGAKRAILLALAVYVGIAIYAAQMNSQREFWIMALAVGAVQGGAQSLSRSLFARLVPAHKAGEFFGLFATLEKFAGVLGPYLFVVFPTSEGAILALIAFFVIGAAILARVDVETGARLAREAEQGVRSDGSLN